MITIAVSSAFAEGSQGNPTIRRTASLHPRDRPLARLSGYRTRGTPPSETLRSFEIRHSAVCSRVPGLDDGYVSNRVWAETTTSVGRNRLVRLSVRRDWTGISCHMLAVGSPSRRRLRSDRASTPAHVLVSRCRPWFSDGRDRFSGGTNDLAQ